MTVGSLLAAGVKRLRRARIRSASLDADLLLSHQLGRERIWLFTHDDAPVHAATAKRFLRAIVQRANGKPVALLRGEQEFFGLTFFVSRATLIPRPESEHLIEAALERIPRSARWQVADVGTGSGCLAVSLAMHRPEIRVVATDRSAAAIAVARRNARRHGVAGRIRFRTGHLLAPLAGPDRPRLVLANLPYLKTGDGALADLRFEPATALVGGPDGLRLYRQLFQQILARQLRPAVIICEIGPGLPGRFRRIATDAGYRVRLEPDLAGRPRVAVLAP